MDLTTVDVTKSIEYQLLHQKRDAVLRSWLLKENIGPFPKKLREFENFKPQFEDFTKKTSDQLMIFFVHKKHYNAPEEQCLTLHRGEWKNYSDMKIAVAELFHINQGEIVVNQYIHAFEDVTRITIDKI